MSDAKSRIPSSKESDDGVIENGDAPSSKPGAKRRASRAGTRSVATLTPEQLARKRTNDREAQRSIRQRTRDHIESLEQRIRDLSGDRQDERNIDDIQRRNEELEEELKRLKDILHALEDDMGSSPLTTSSMVSFYMNALREPRHYSYAQPWSRSSPNSMTSALSGSIPLTNAGDLWTTVPAYSASNSEFSTAGSSRSDSFSSDAGFSAAAAAGGPLAPPTRPGMLRAGSRPQFGRSISYPYGGLGRTESSWSSIQAPSSSFNDNYLSTNSPSVGSSAVASPIIPPTMTNEAIPQMDPTPTVSASVPISYDVPTVTTQPSLPAWELPLRLVPPTGPVDSILIGLLQRQRGLAISGNPREIVIGPYSPSLKALLNPEQSNTVHPVASVITSLLQRTALRGLPEKVAALFVMNHLCQWQILPSEETYNNLAEWHIPRASQLLTPHPIWIDQIAWGKLRDVVINNQEQYATDEFQHTYTHSLNVNWPYRDMDVMVFEGSEVRVSDLFACHILELSNWSLDEPFQRKYPELRESCKFTGFQGPEANGTA
ncbi:hypothetical protein N431DRAFT_366476 [Stipitochalara longipes BDJ]|nr:hypothetical protein N431DRAFT_366476 [Stipitochalara longipes BDJ]